MRRITKGPEPKALTEHRARRGGSFDDIRDKGYLRDALLREQRHLCCYCMRRIDKETMKIEHFLPQSRHPDKAIDWGNLLGACPGNAGMPWRLQTCDTRKGDREIRLDPKGSLVDRVRYSNSGHVEIDEPELQQELDVALNLNTAQLVANRRNALQGLIEVLRRERGKTGSWSGDALLRKLARMDAEGRLDEYVGVLESWLRRHARRS
jgi:uncharacterized protein (TIGR02646 family)